MATSQDRAASHDDTFPEEQELEKARSISVKLIERQYIEQLWNDSFIRNCPDLVLVKTIKEATKAFYDARAVEDKENIEDDYDASISGN